MKRKRLIRLLLWYFKTRYLFVFTSRREITRHQEKRLAQQLEFVRGHSPFYRLYYEGLDVRGTLESVALLPTIDKQLMMEQFDSLNTRGFTREEAFEVALKAENSRNFQPMLNDVTVGLSSGTSGSRGLFLASESERSQWAGVVLAKLLPRGLFQAERIAFFLRANSNLYESVSSKRIDFQFFDLSDSLQEHIRRLNDLLPTILVGPPSLLRILADHIEKELLHIKPIKVISVAEVLDPLDQNYLEKVFGMTMHQVYQCTEGFLASTCEQGTLHLHEDLLLFEKQFLDEGHTKFTPILTDLYRRTQPLIRYELNDILTLKEQPCSCGSPMTAIAQIEGRSDDLFYFPSHKGQLHRIFPDFIRRSVITSSLNIKEYKVIQHSLTLLEVQLLTFTDQLLTEEEVKAALLAFLTEQMVKLPMITFIPYESHQGLKKLKRIERRFSLEDQS